MSGNIPLSTGEDPCVCAPVAGLFAGPSSRDVSICLCLPFCAASTFLPIPSEGRVFHPADESHVTWDCHVFETHQTSNLDFSLEELGGERRDTRCTRVLAWHRGHVRHPVVGAGWVRPKLGIAWSQGTPDAEQKATCAREGWPSADHGGEETGEGMD